MKTEYLLLALVAGYFLLVKGKGPAPAAGTIALPNSTVPSPNAPKDPVTALIDQINGVYDSATGLITNVGKHVGMTSINTSPGDPGQSVAAQPAGFQVGTSAVRYSSVPVAVNNPAPRTRNDLPRIAKTSPRVAVASNVVPYSPYASTADQVLHIMRSV